LGNIIGSHLPADIFARFCRLSSYETILIGGTDEYGTAIEIASKQAGRTPEELCDFFFKLHKEIYDWFNISYDNFSRTSRPIHTETVQEIFLQVYKKGFIEEKEIEIPYSEEDDLYLSDRFVIGTCPHCGYEKARGDQCENCGTMLDPKDLINIKSSISGSSKITFVKKKHLFLKLDALQPKLKAWINKNKTWRSNVKAIALSWLNEGLKSRDITRELSWGIPVPLEGFEESVFYVWFDAPIGYISSTKERFPKTWKDYWQNEDTELYHFIGKDNIPFHTLFFPAMLIADSRYILPHNVVGLQYLNFERKKFSKSQGHGVFCENLLDTDLGSDYWRFYLSFIIPETKDTEFLWADFEKRINTELIGNFSNFVNRTLSFTHKNFSGMIPKGILDKKVEKDIKKQVEEILKNFENVELRQSLLNILKLSDYGNKYFEENKPWETKSADVLYICGNLVKILSLLIQPFIPDASQKILDTLNCEEINFDELVSFNLKDHNIKQPKILFEKIDEAKIEELKIKTSKVTDFFGKTPFEKLDIVVGKVVKSEYHPDADKLYILEVDIGTEKRSIVTGLRDHYSLEDLEGRNLAFLKNLEPAKIRGVTSDGMLLAACSEDDKIVVLLKPEGEPGDRIFADANQRSPDKLLSYSEFKSLSGDL
jgi:methionyl-tRNA synthetase